jgi:uncharacterized protein
MSAPAVIDSLDLARGEQCVSDSLSVASLKRLEDVLFDSEGTLSFEIQGGRDERRRPQLMLHITGELHLQCQRCLGLLRYPVEVINTLLLVAPGTPTDENLDDVDAPDAIEASPELDVRALIEDEVLLSLPLSPRHEDGACIERVEARAVGEVQHASAFAKLAALKASRSQH